jgi:hypothetical protein
MVAIGIDYSLTSPCVCVATDNVFQNSQFYYLNDRKVVQGRFQNILGKEHPPYLSNEQRYENNANWVLSLISGFKQANQKVEIMIEDYSFGSKGRVFNLAENCGVLKYVLFKNGFSFSTVAPTVVKKFATGKGNATKEKMYEAFIAQTNIKLHTAISPTTKLGSPTTDVVDSWFIAKYLLEKI